MELLDFDKITKKDVAVKILKCFFENIPVEMVYGFEQTSSIIIGFTHIDNAFNNLVFSVEINRNGEFNITNYFDSYKHYEKYKNVETAYNFLRFYELLLTFKMNG